MPTADPEPPFSARLLSGWGRDIAVAGAFLTRLPLRPAGADAAGALALAARAFPLIGLGVGAVAAGGLWLASGLGLHPIGCALIGLALAAALTGALHEDGLADVADGFGGGSDCNAKLKIMRDSRIGAFGVLALIFSVGIRTTVLGGLMGPGLAEATLVCAAVVSRAVLPMMMARMPMARSDGLAAAAGTPNDETAWTALVLGTVGSIVLLGLMSGLIAVASACVTTVAVAWLSRRQIRGYTGDVLGAVQQVVETAVIIAAGATAL